MIAIKIILSLPFWLIFLSGFWHRDLILMTQALQSHFENLQALISIYSFEFQKYELWFTNIPGSSLSDVFCSSLRIILVLVSILSFYMLYKILQMNTLFVVHISGIRWMSIPNIKTLDMIFYNCYCYEWYAKNALEFIYCKICSFFLFCFLSFSNSKLYYIIIVLDILDVHS